MNHMWGKIKTPVVVLTNHLAGVSQWAETRPTVAGESYASRLDKALEQSDLSVREVARRLAELTGNPLDDERSAIYRYRKGTEPAPDRAVLLASILEAPELGTVTPRSERRRGRLAELSDEVAKLRAEHDSFVEGVLARLAGLEAAQAGEEPRSDQQSEAGE